MTDLVTVYKSPKHKKKQDMIKKEPPLDERHVLDHIGALMSDEQFRRFFQSYFDDWSEIKMIIMCMKMYELVDQYHKQQGFTLSSSEILDIVRKTLMNHETRAVLIGELSKFTQGLESCFDFRKLAGGKYLPILKSNPSQKT